MPAEKKDVRARPVIRRARRKDAGPIAEIVQESPQAANWSKKSYEELGALSGEYALVCETGGKVTGFLIGRQAADEAEVLNLAVRLEDRRSGNGGALLGEFLDRARSNGVRRAFLEVRESNAAGIAFYERHGFVQTGRRKGYYQAPKEDAIAMERKLTG